jgi:NADH-quinone oxidoreductase subunit L
MGVQSILFLIPLLPLAGFLVLALRGAKLPRGAIGPLACAGPALAFLIALAGFFAVRPEGARLVNHLGDWMRSGGTAVEFTFTLDRLSAVLALVVTGVGTLIHVYSIGYMRDDPRYPRFFAYLNFFMAAMLILTLADNLVLLFMGWEGVGLASYLLIGFWFEEEANAAAGRKAFVVNRIGDFAFILGVFLAFQTFGSFRLEDLVKPEKLAAASPAALTGIALLLFAGATGKSAQIPLYVWLPDAMAGPTPVSALIHAATMVTSGVYLVARLEPLYQAAPGALPVVAAVGGLTALVAGFIALSQFDIKRVLAYSTVSQLGYMFLAAGLGSGAVAVYHLVTHAFFKALLFLGAGAVIHSLHHEQDLRRMGGLKRSLPRTYLVFLTGSLALSGFPLLSGFFSKDAILHSAQTRAFGGGALWVALWLLAVLTAVLTAFYTFRMVFLAFAGEERWRQQAGGGHGKQEALHEAPPVMMMPLWVLAVLSVLGGWIDVPGFLSRGEGEHAGGKWLAYLVSVLAFAVGLAGAWHLYLSAPSARTGLERQPLLRGLLRLSAGKLYVDEFYDLAVVKPFQAVCAVLYYLVDRILIDLVLVEGTGAAARGFASVFRRVQSGRVPAYAAWFMAGTVAVLAALALLGG